MSPMQREVRAEVAAYLGRSLGGRVGLDVWTRAESGLVLPDRDGCTHCDAVEESAREIATTHDAVSLTRYDLDRHAARAKEAGIERAPTTVIRGGGRSLRFVGYWSGPLLAPLVTVLGLLGGGVRPLAEEGREALGALPEAVDIELAVTPFDPISPQLMLLLGAIAAEARDVNVTITEYAEFPKLAARRSVVELPTLWIGERRYVGVWRDDELIEQVARAAAGNVEPVIRESTLSVPYLSEEGARQLARQTRAEQGGDPGFPGVAPGTETSPGSGGSGLIVPGRG